MAKIPFTLTYVVYDDGDFFGFLLALMTLTPIFFVVSYVTLVLVSGFDPRLVYLFLGQLINVGVNLVLKHIIKEPRPQAEHLIHFGKYGMPSNHTQFCFFLASFLSLVSLRIIFINRKRKKGNGSDTSVLVFPLFKRYPILFHLSSIFAIIVSFLVAYSRVYLGYHTLSQVMVGAFVGISCGSFWFLLFLFIKPKYDNFAHEHYQ